MNAELKAIVKAFFDQIKASEPFWTHMMLDAMLDRLNAAIDAGIDQVIPQLNALKEHLNTLK